MHQKVLLVEMATDFWFYSKRFSENEKFFIPEISLRQQCDKKKWKEKLFNVRNSIFFYYISILIAVLSDLYSFNFPDSQKWKTNVNGLRQNKLDLFNDKTKCKKYTSYQTKITIYCDDKEKVNYNERCYKNKLQNMVKTWKRWQTFPADLWWKTVLTLSNEYHWILSDLNQ